MAVILVQTPMFSNGPAILKKRIGYPLHSIMAMVRSPLRVYRLAKLLIQLRLFGCISSQWNRRSKVLVSLG